MGALASLRQEEAKKIKLHVKNGIFNIDIPKRAILHTTYGARVYTEATLETVGIAITASAIALLYEKNSRKRKKIRSVAKDIDIFFTEEK